MSAAGGIVAIILFALALVAAAWLLARSIARAENKIARQRLGLEPYGDVCEVPRELRTGGPEGQRGEATEHGATRPDTHTHYGSNTP